MTEAEWLTATNPTPLLEFLEGKASDRKLRLFAVACCGRIWEWIRHDACRNAVLVAERFADGLASREECNSAGEAATVVADTEKQFVDVTASCAVSWATSTGPLDWNASTWSLASAARSTAYHAAQVYEDKTNEQVEQTALAQDIFGNPFRPVAVAPCWLTSTVVRLAEGIYHDRAFDRMPILADALQDAGCDNDDILNHCREPRAHVRGCWVVDAVLNKE